MKKIVSPVTTTVTTYACEKCGFTSPSPGEMEKHEFRHVAPEERRFGEVYVVKFSSREEVSRWSFLSGGGSTCDRVKCEWDGPGWYVLEESDEKSWGGDDRHVYTFTPLTEYRKNLYQEMCDLGNLYRALKKMEESPRDDAACGKGRAFPYDPSHG